MEKKRENKPEFSYYSMPAGGHVLSDPHHMGGGPGDPLHFHNYLEIGCCLAGEGRLRLKDREHPFCAGMFSIIPPQYPHLVFSGEQDGWEHLMIDVEGFLLELFPFGLPPEGELLEKIYRKAHVFTHEENPALGDLILELAREQKRETIYHREKTRGLLLLLMVEIARLVSEEGEKTLSPTEKSDPERILHALEYVQKHYAQQFGVRELAQECGFSESHFRREFQQVMLMGPMEYVTRIRIFQACILLEHPEVTVEEAAMKTGFVSLSTFRRNFRRQMGMSPHQWKAEFKGKKRQHE